MNAIMLRLRSLQAALDFWEAALEGRHCSLGTASSYPTIQLMSTLYNHTKGYCRHTIPLLHSKVACLSERHCSGNSSGCSRRHSDGRRPFLTTQSECRRQSLSAASRC